jgi:hypothetical protein
VSKGGWPHGERAAARCSGRLQRLPLFFVVISLERFKNALRDGDILAHFCRKP